MFSRVKQSHFKPMYESCLEQAQNSPKHFDFNYGCNRITYELLQPNDIPEAIECVGKEFTRSIAGEPMSNHLKATTEDFINSLSHYSEILAKDELTFVAKDTLNGKIVGTVLSWDLHSEKNLNVPKLEATDRLFSFFDILSQLEAKHYGETHADKYKEYFHQIFAAVDRDYRGQNILFNLLMLTNIKAKCDGYRGVYIEPTEPISQNIVLRYLGYDELGRISYDEYSHPLTQNKVFRGAYLNFPIKESESRSNDDEFTDSNTSGSAGVNKQNKFDCLICFKDLVYPSSDELIGA